MLDVRNICVERSGRMVLDDVSFTLNAGQTVAVVGANGAGKTTLARSINGSLPLSAGAILFEGADIRSLPRREIAKNIAVVAQETEVRFPITVTEFVLSGRFANAAAWGWETAADMEAAQRAIADSDLDGMRTRLTSSLSGGERQRAVLARALATDAKLFLFDEPTANLDMIHQVGMFRLIRRRCGERGAAALVVTHDLNLASEFADHIIMLHNGRIYALGPPAEVLTAGAVKAVFGVEVVIDRSPVSGNVRVTNIF